MFLHAADELSDTIVLEHRSQDLVDLIIGILFGRQILFKHRAMSAETMSTLLTRKFLLLLLQSFEFLVLDLEFILQPLLLCPQIL